MLKVLNENIDANKEPFIVCGLFFHYFLVST